MFILQKEFSKELTKIDLIEARNKYKEMLKSNPFPNINKDTTYTTIENLKRTKFKIGPYENLTIFEISNRLFSDLVVLDGALRIFNKPSLVGASKINNIKVLLSNINGFDLEINTNNDLVYGEAFNVAESFFQGKTRTTIKKISKSDEVQKAIIIANKDCLTDKNKNYIENKVLENDKLINFIACELKDWKKI